MDKMNLTTDNLPKEIKNVLKMLRIMFRAF